MCPVAQTIPCHSFIIESPARISMKVIFESSPFATMLRRKAMNESQIKGRANEAKGKIKEVTGKVTGNKETEYKGKAQKHAGKAEAKYGDMKSDLKKEKK